MDLVDVRTGGQRTRADHRAEASTGIALSFNDPSKPQALDPARRPKAISPTNPPVASPAPMQVVRKQQIQPEAMKMNNAYWSLPGIKGTVWENYMLVATQWPTQISPEDPNNDGKPFPDGGSEIANTTMETYFSLMAAAARYAIRYPTNRGAISSCS